jgi:DNA primase
MKKNDSIRLPDDQVYDILANVNKGPKNHLISDCPLCNKQRHFYFNTITQKWDCKKCGEAGDIIRLLSLIGKLALIRRFVDVTKELQSKLADLLSHQQDELEEVLELPPVRLPQGFKFLHQHPYLDGRGFLDSDYKRYPVGCTSIVNKFDEYIIFPVLEDGEAKGFVGRKTWDKDQFRKHEKEHGWAPPRYANSKTNFSLLLYGLDEIMFYVDTAILVEGVFTKTACDRRLQISHDDNFRCLATFGKKISRAQIMKLLLKGIKNIILIFDPDAVDEAYKYARQLQKYFKVQIGFVSGGDLDECDDDSFIRCFQNLMEPVEFKNSIIQKKKLV